MCAGYVGQPSLNKRCRTRKQSCIVKANWLFVSACHAGLLADNQTPVGSGEIIYAFF